MQTRKFQPMNLAELNWRRERQKNIKEPTIKTTSNATSVDVKESNGNEISNSNAPPQPILKKPDFYGKKEEADNGPTGRLWQLRPDLSPEQMRQMLLDNM